MNDQRIRQILSDLERVQENLLALSDDIWLNIYHNNQEALSKGCEFKQSFNQCMSTFVVAADDLSVLIQSYTEVPIEPDIVDAGTAGTEEQRRGIIQELDRQIPHTLDENFSYKRPYGFVLAGQAYENVGSWRQLYVLVCRQLYAADPALFRSLPEQPEFAGRRSFTADGAEFNARRLIAQDLYAEGNRSTWDITQEIKKLLRIYKIDPQEMVIYLREDRNVQNESPAS